MSTTDYTAEYWFHATLLTAAYHGWLHDAPVDWADVANSLTYFKEHTTGHIPVARLVMRLTAVMEDME